MSQKYDLILKEVFKIDVNTNPKELVKGLEDKITGEKKFKTETYQDEENSEIIIKYTSKHKENKVTNLCIAAGLPNEEFDRAEKAYLLTTKEKGKDYQYTLEGNLLGGTLAQYAGLMSEGYIKNYQVISYNGLGLENFLEFKGNEFLGYEIGLLYYLNDTFHGGSKLDIVRNELVHQGVIENGNISSKFRKSLGQKLNVKAIKEVLKKIFIRELNLDKKEANNLVEESFNPYIVERKMRFIDKYKKHKERKRESKENIINYIISDNIPARLLEQVGATYVVDKNLKQLNKGLDEKINSRIKRLEKNQVKELIHQEFDLFEPFILSKKEGNAKSAVNRLRQEPEVGNVTNNLSLDYLRALVKDIILDLKEKDDAFLKEIFRLSRLGEEREIREIIKDRLRHSLKLQKKLTDPQNNAKGGIFKSRYFRDNPGLLTEDDKAYRLAGVALDQLEMRMRYSELEELWCWNLTGEDVFLILGTKLEDDEEVVAYHASEAKQKFTNEEVELKIELNKPSRNKIYGTHQQRSNYKEEYDTEYLVEKEDVYQFLPTQGIGTMILSQYTNPDRTIEIDGQDISGTYKEVDEIKGKTKVGGERYYGENIIHKPDNYELIYLYGPDKEDKLVIDGFKNGDYGIELKSKVTEKKEEKAPVTYTPHQVKFDAFEFVSLDKLEIKKSIYDHTRVHITGMISEENVADYKKYLVGEDPKLVITHGEEDNRILFKGIIESYGLEYRGHDYFLTLEAVSHSILLERRKKNRIYQNLGTTYKQVFAKLMEANPEFYLTCAGEELGATPLVSKDYPVVLQYQENEWDFLKRICSYLNQILIVDDMKDDEETVNILAGPHAAAPEELNNVTGSKIRKIIKKNHKFYYYKVERHECYRSDNIFDIGRKVKYRTNNQQEKTVELIIIKNKIYVEDGILYSDLTLVQEEDINILKRRRKKAIAGKSFRAEVKQVNKNHTAQVEFVDLASEYKQAKSFRFPIDRPYTNGYFAPEVGDIVDIYFKSKNERYATLKSSTSDNGQEINHEPADKLIKTPGGFKIGFNNERILLAGKDEKSKLQIKDRIKLAVTDKKRTRESNLEVTKDKIALQSGQGQGLVDETKIKLSCGGKRLKIDGDKIYLS